jgi:CRP/FNR family transcriptional regulator
MPHDPLPHIREVSFLRELSAEALGAVASRMVRRAVPSGYTLFRRGEACRGVYFLIEGEVEIYRSTPDGRQQVLHVEKPVASVAELPAFDGDEYPASARTSEASVLYFLSVEDVHRLYREHPEIADAVIRDLARRLRVMVRLVDRISLKSVPARIAALLLDHAGKSGQLKRGGTFSLERTHEEVAHQLATSRESVARALGTFRRKEWISQDGRKITLLDPAALQALARQEGDATG